AVRAALADAEDVHTRPVPDRPGHHHLRRGRRHDRRAGDGSGGEWPTWCNTGEAVFRQLTRIERVMDQHHALRGKQHARAEAYLFRTETLEAVEALLWHRNMVGEQEADIGRKFLLADRRALRVHGKQRV